MEVPAKAAVGVASGVVAIVPAKGGNLDRAIPVANRVGFPVGYPVASPAAIPVAIRVANPVECDIPVANPAVNLMALPVAIPVTIPAANLVAFPAANLAAISGVGTAVWVASRPAEILAAEAAAVAVTGKTDSRLTSSCTSLYMLIFIDHILYNLPLKSSYPNDFTTRVRSSPSSNAMEGKFMPLNVLFLTMV